MVIKDEEWLRSTFMVPVERYDEEAAKRREFTTAQYKFTDTTLGGNFTINTPPQYTRFADLRVPSRYSQSAGMGRYYSEAIDDRGQVVHMRFGVPEFNTLSNFFFNFFNSGASSLANRGRAFDGFMFIGAAAGFIISLPAQPFLWFGSVVSFLKNKPVSRFYYMKPTMYLYWATVSNIVNTIGVNMGVIGRALSDSDEIMRPDDPNQLAENAAHYENLAAGDGFPNVYRPDGGVDIYRVATRAQRMANIQRKNLNSAVEGSGSWVAMAEAIKGAFSGQMEEPDMQNADLGAYGSSYFSSEQNNIQKDSEEAKNKETNADDTAPENVVTYSKVSEDSFVSHLEGELKDGAAFISLRVDQQDSVSESFQNSATESQIQSAINSVSAAGRQSQFSLARGNITGTIGQIYDSVASVVQGAAASVGMDGLAATLGSAFVDIPKVWESSTANLPTATYTIELRSPYGSPLARFQNLIVPLSMILAGALPLATGKQSYTSPFLCELYSQGRQQIRLGMIESLTITRGAGNVGWTPDGEPLGIDVSFTVMDLSSVLHLPITSNFGVLGGLTQGAAAGAGSLIDAAAGGMGMETNAQQGAQDIMTLLDKSTFDDDSPFSDYMAVLGSLSLSSQIYPTNKLRLRLAQNRAHYQQWTSGAHLASLMSSNSMGRTIKRMLAGTERE